MSTTIPRPTQTRTRPPVISLTSPTVTPFSFPSGSPSISGFTISPSNGGGSGGGSGSGNNRGRNSASNASLYLYTFLATLILLLSVSAAIVARSFILRRRHRRLVEEAIRNGTWLPSQDDDDINGGLGGRFGRRLGGRVDLSKRPKMWDVHLDAGCLGHSGGVSSEKHALYGGASVKGGSREGDVMEDWDAIKPVSVSYVVASPLPVGKSAAMSPGTASTVIEGGAPSNSEGQQLGRGEMQRRGVLRRAGTLVADFFRPPRPRDFENVSRLPTSNVPGFSEQQGTGEEQSGGTGVKVSGGSTVRVAVLIAMPHPPSDARQADALGTGSGSSSSDNLSMYKPSSLISHALGQTHTHPLSPSAAHSQPSSLADEHPLPVLELGVADVLIAAREVEDDGSGEKDRLHGRRAKDVDGRDSASLGEGAGADAGAGAGAGARFNAPTTASVDTGDRVI